jgi:hypothetical protein
MPTPHRRIHVTLTPELETVLDELHRLTGERPATIVRSLLTEAIPGLQAMGKALQHAQEGAPREAVEQMLDVLEKEVSSARQIGLEFREKYPRRRRKRVP